MASVKLAYIGGGSTRAPGTLASFIRQAKNFSGSEIALHDLDAERLELVRQLATRMAEVAGADLRITATTDQRDALHGCDGVLSSYRPGGFEARALDERIPLNHGAISQETQGAGGFFMALRAIQVARELVADMEAVCPDATLFNYTNPVNVVAQAISDHSPIRVVSLCEGPIVFPREIAELAGLDPTQVSAVMLGLNHACWSEQSGGGARYGDQPLLPLLAQKLEAGIADDWARRWISLAVQMNSLPASYMKYYYFEAEMLEDLGSRATTRAQDIQSDVPHYWQHYREQVEATNPVLDPALSRGGIFELEVAVDVMDAMFNNKGEIWPTNVRNNGAIQDFPDSLVVEVPCRVDRSGVWPLSGYRTPPAVRGLLGSLGEYQQLTADAAWDGNRQQAVQALLSNPLVRSLPLAQTLYAELTAAHRAHLPERLW